MTNYRLPAIIKHLLLLFLLAGCQKAPPAIPTILPTAYISPQPTAAAALLPITPPPTFTPQPPSPPSPTPTRTPKPTNTPSPPPTIVTATLTLGPTPPPLLLTPGNPQPYLTTYRLVTFYGNPLGPDLGILGESPPEVMLAQLRDLAAQYQALAPDRYVLPTFHIVSTVADAHPGDYDNYSHWMSENTLDTWIAMAKAEGVAVILDIQPGYASINYEFQRIKHYLYEPHVHLALDSEFTMHDGAIPGQTLGQLYASEINPVQEQLNQIALEIGINKVLILHQFEGLMLPNKEDIVDYPYVELVIDADGFGSPQAKIGDYLDYASGPAFEYGGFKLFFNWDNPLLLPEDLMTLEPRPAIIVYQ